MSFKSPTGMTAFLIVWFGQVVSLIGSSMVRFGIAVWAWEITGQATSLGFLLFFSTIPSVLFSPIAGALVDRWNRKLVMALSDLAAGVGSILILWLYQADNLQIWHLYVISGVAGIFESFQWPAYSAATSIMLSKEHYGRASGLSSLAEWGSGIFAPVFASMLYVTIGLEGLLTIDIVTFVFALGMLAVVFIPNPPPSKEGRASQGSLWQEALYGFRYIEQRRSLLGVQLIFTTINLTGAVTVALFPAMVLAKTDNNTFVLGIAQGFGAIGGVLGSIALVIWGGPKRLIHGILFSVIYSYLFSGFLLATSQSLNMWAAGMFLGGITMPILNASNQALWQSKVPPDVQGKVFSVRRLIAQITFPLGSALAGILADHVFEPAFAENSGLADLFGWLVGTGVGSGMGMLILMAGLMGVSAGVVGYLLPVIRDVEDRLPNHDVKPIVAEDLPTETVEIELQPA